MSEPLTPLTLRQGVDALTARDPDLAAIASSYGPPPLWDREPGFHTLIHIILEQQVSLASARVAYERLNAAIQPITPERFLELTDVELKAIGFSRQKTRYGRELAHAIQTGALDLSALATLSDDAVRTQLTTVKGIGLWTANIYLLMALGRPDIWPRGDLALHIAMQKMKGWEQRPTSDDAETFSEKWRPWRAIAARMLWHFYLSQPRKSRRHS